MLIPIKRILAPPVFADEDKTRLAILLNDIFLGAIVIVLILNLLLLLVLPFSLPPLAVISVWLLLAIAGLSLLRRGHVKATGLAFAIISWLFITLAALLSGGVSTPGFASYMAIILMAGLVYGTRAGIVFAILSIASGAVMLYAELDGGLVSPPLPNNSVLMWAGLSLNFANTAALVHLATRRIYSALKRVRRSETNLRSVLETLQRTEKRYRELFEEAPAMIVITRKQPLGPVIVDCNALFLRTLGYPRSEVLSRPLADFYTPASRARLLEGGGYARALDDHFEVEERQLVARNGRIIDTLLRARPEAGPDGRVNGTQAVFADITERKRSEMELDRYRQRLEDLVAERTAELTRANQRLRQEIAERKHTEEELQQRNLELILLNRSAQAFNSSLDLDHVLRLVLQEMQHLLHITAASFWLVVPETGGLVCRQATGPGSETVQGWQLQPGQGLAGWVAQTGQPLLVPDTSTDERHFKGVDQQIDLELRSILSIPLKAKEEVIGVLNLVDTCVRRFSLADLTMLEPLVASAAIAIENARLHAAVQTELAVRQQAEAALRRLNEELEQRVEERTLALRRSEQMFRDLAENIREVFWVREGERMLYVSPAYEEVWGRSRDSLYRNPGVFVDSIASVDKGKMMAVLGTPLGRQYIFNQEYRIVRPDGSQRWVWARSFPVQKDDGAVQSVGIAEDITERKQMEERLATIYRLGQELTLLQDEAAIIRQVLDMAGRILHINFAGCGLIDAMAGDLVYYYGTGAGADIRQKRLSLDDELPYVGQLAIRRKQTIYVPDVQQDLDYASFVDGTVVRAELCVPMQVGDWNIGVLHAGSASPNYFSPADQQLLQTLAGQTAVALENARLYSELRQNLDELTRLNAENSRLFQAERSRYREAEALRRAALALTATMDQAELLNRILTELQVVIPYDSAAVFVLKDDHLEIVGGRGFADLSTVIGARIPLQAEFSPDYQVITSLQPVIIPDTSASPLALAHLTPGTALIRSWLAVPLVAQDRPMGMITLDKHQPNFYNETHAQTAQAYAAQAAIALENARLYHDLQHQIQAVQAAQARLIQSERMAALGRLMASIAHEINNPLQGVQGFLSLLGEELEDRHRPDKINAYLTITNQEIERIAGIVHRMREFCRPASQDITGGAEFSNGFYHLKAEELQAVDVHLVLESVLQLVNKKLQQNRVEVERQWARKLPYVQGSPDHLKQVFLNLVLNALDALPVGGGRLRIRTILEGMPLSTDRSEQAVRIEFSDTGAGMPPEVLSRIFEPMFSTKEHGSGFGLFISYQIIAAHHGHISATSREGEGTTLSILLPLEQPVTP